MEVIQYDGRAPDGRKLLDFRPRETGFARLALDVDDIVAVLAVA